MTFTNTTGAPAAGVKLSISVPQAVDLCCSGHHQDVNDHRGSGRTGCQRERDLQGHFGAGSVQRRPGRHRLLDGSTTGRTQSETTAEKVRNVSPIKINEFRINAGSPTNSTDSFIELYNAGARSVDISNWTLTHHQTQLASSRL